MKSNEPSPDVFQNQKRSVERVPARSEEEFFPESDKEIVRTGLRKLAELLRSMEEKPELVLCLETSGRPFYYACKDVLDVEVYEAFKKHNPNVDLTCFAFLSGISYLEKEFFEEEDNKDMDPEPHIPNLHITTAIDDPETSRYGSRGPVLYTYGFRFREADTPIFGGSAQAEEIIGVRKSNTSAIVEPVKNKNPEEMRMLRSAFQRLGKEVASEILTEYI
jgi:hypothetical protein